MYFYYFVNSIANIYDIFIPLKIFLADRKINNKMAGWLGSNFTAQFDQIKKGVSQVSTIVKDTLVVDETWDQDDDEIDENISENPSYSREKELLRECKRLEKLHKVGIFQIFKFGPLN